jgi:hypothetical protein
MSVNLSIRPHYSNREVLEGFFRNFVWSLCHWILDAGTINMANVRTSKVGKTLAPFAVVQSSGVRLCIFGNVQDFSIVSSSLYNLK